MSATGFAGSIGLIGLITRSPSDAGAGDEKGAVGSGRLNAGLARASLGGTGGENGADACGAGAGGGVPEV